jgi:transcriptional regulator with XRE-family HTH domain
VKSKEFKAQRESKGYSQSELAKVFQVTVRTISRWENGDRKIPHIAFIALESLKSKKGGKQ